MHSYAIKSYPAHATSPSSATRASFIWRASDLNSSPTIFSALIRVRTYLQKPSSRTSMQSHDIDVDCQP